MRSAHLGFVMRIQGDGRVKAICAVPASMKWSIYYCKGPAAGRRHTFRYAKRA